ncbi:flagellar hook-length control protein FliK [Halomonas sp.]|uniref:flagellar hook-length control protein FliK n=1 Tax=Halomonas sp. TaxID=1486246 RepID=UPI00298EBACF|nr:flagellar hook-length control protein FliK [Halomonas sp.]MDW7745238.1 flagellar hook-length control protein FliK [Halomonas sp.]
MDIQQLMTIAAIPAKAPAWRGGDSSSSGGFANELAQAGMGGKTKVPFTQASTAPSEALPALDEAGLEALRRAFGSGDMSALLDWLGEAGMAQAQTEELLAGAKALMQQLENNETTVLPIQLDLAGHDDARQPTQDAAGETDEWAALRERLSLIDQAGRTAESERDEQVAPALTTLMPQLAQGDGARELDALRRGQGGRGQSHAEAPSRISLQGAILEAMQRGSQAQTDASSPARLSSADALTAAFGRQAEAAPSVMGNSQTDAQRGGLLEGLSTLTGNTAAGAQPANASAQSTASLSAPVNSPAWPQQLGQQLVRMSQSGGEQRVELQLHPAELGPLSVSLKFGDQGAQAQFLSAHAQVRQVLEQALPQLREALAEQGIELGEATVGEQRTGDGKGGESGEGSQPMMAGGALGEGVDSDLEGVSEIASGREIRLHGRVDLYA